MPVGARHAVPLQLAAALPRRVIRSARPHRVSRVAHTLKIILDIPRPLPYTVTKTLERVLSLTGLSLVFRNINPQNAIPAFPTQSAVVCRRKFGPYGHVLRSADERANQPE